VLFVGRRSGAFVLAVAGAVACLTAAGSPALAAPPPPLTVTSVPLPPPIDAPFIPSAASDVSATGVVVGWGPAATDAGALTLHACRWQNGVLTDLNPAGATGSQARTVNLIGDVGLEVTSADYSTHAYLLHGTTLTALEPTGATTSNVIDMNEFSQVLIGWTDAVGVHRGLWSRGQLTEITSATEEGVGAAFVNTRGQVAGLFRTRGSTVAQARIWQGGRFTTLGPDITAVTGLSERGDVVGNSTDASGTTQAFHWYRGVLTTLPGGALGGAARAVNNVGQVAGTVRLVDGASHAAFWSGGTLTDLGTLGGTTSVASGINDLGQIAGTSGGLRGPTGYPIAHAFVWQGGTFTDLTPVIPNVNDTYSAGQITDTGYVTGNRNTLALPSRSTDRAQAWRVR
jgi:probable HAF family extracellular repeat protein